MMNYPEHDKQYEDHTIDKVDGDREAGWTIRQQDGAWFGVPSESPVEPKVGMSARFYGKGLGYVVRGLFLDGQKVFYRSIAEQDQHEAKRADEREHKQRQDFEDSRAEMDAKYDALPEVFKRRIDKFRMNNPDFRWKYESYEMFCCEQAVEIAKVMTTPEAVQSFARMESAVRYQVVPNLSRDHSGNTFGAAVQLAYWYLHGPNNVVAMHGALAPLVGSKEYGCVPRNRLNK